MITKKLTGKSDKGEDIYLFTICSGYGQVTVSSLGASIESIIVPDINGNHVDVALGFDSIKAREEHEQYMGSIIGRHANRIEKGRFVLNGRVYILAVNNPPNHLHGGNYGFDKKVWMGDIQGDTLYFHYRSADGEEGYPGNLDVTVSYGFDDSGTLTIGYDAVSDEDTVVNLTNHAYFNLSGHDDGSILDHMLAIKSSCFTENDKDCLPDGNIVPVEGTPMDFRNFRMIGEGIDSEYSGIKNAGGYDHNYIIDKKPDEFGLAAQAVSPKTGIMMSVYTDMPGMQFYSGNAIKDVPPGKGGCVYTRRSGFCLETQYYPNALSHSHFPSPILKAGQRYSHKTYYRFGTSGDFGSKLE